jgi:type II secretion system protein N
MKFRNILYILISIPMFIMLTWYFAVPTDLIHEQIKDFISNSTGADINATITGLRKGVLPGLHADTLDLSIDEKPALNIEDLSVIFNPGYLLKKQLAFSISGKIGGGNINGLVKLPARGEIKIERAELNAIPYLTRFSINVNGHVFAGINIKDNAAKIRFEVPDLIIDDSASVIPLLNTFRKLQGALSVNENNLKVDSISLEGEKGYARLKGDITNGVMNLSLELMPVKDRINAMESMLIGKYIVSPGYYIIPIKGPLLQ